LESKQLAEANDELATTNQDLHKKLEQYSQQADQELELPLQPIGYKDNNGRVSTQVPIGDGYYTNTKLIKLRPDGQVNLLIRKDYNKDPFTINLLLTPDYLNEEVTKPMPLWFLNLLHSPTPTYHTLRKAAYNLDDWAVISEVKRYRQYNDQCHCLAAKLDEVQAELELVEDTLAASCHHMEAVRLPTHLANLEG
jgi:hypothetical protein